MAKQKPTEKGVFIRTDYLLLPGKVRAVKLYADQINKKCLPVIKELSLDSNDIKRVIRYSCAGGRARMLSDFLADLPEGNAFRKVAERQFNTIMSLHPEYEECANTWKYANLICIAEDGLVHADEAAIQETLKVVVKTPEGLSYMDKLYKAIDALNDLCEGTFSLPFEVFYKSIYFDDNTKRWAMNPAHLSDRFISCLYSKEYHTPGNDFLTKKVKEQQQKQKQINVETIREFGIDGDEAKAAEAADNSIK